MSYRGRDESLRLGLAVFLCCQIFGSLSDVGRTILGVHFKTYLPEGALSPVTATAYISRMAFRMAVPGTSRSLRSC